MALPSGVQLGPYKVLGALGAGGMGEVYRARDTRLDRSVAIKVLPAAFSGDEDRLRRFELEAKAVGALNHPNIVAVFDVGFHDGAPYIVSELLEGQTLREVLRSLTARKALDYGVQIARGLAAAHDKGIVHRDLKPENILVAEDGRVKILDFGLAKTVRPTAPVDALSAAATVSQETDPGTVLGTVGYMSPEQIRGLPADQRSDIFSLGAVLYEMLSGKRAFRGATPADTMLAILKEDPPDLSTTGPMLAPAVDRIVRRCLEKAPAERLQSARDVAFCLESLSTPSGLSVTVEAFAGVRSRRWPRRIGLAVGLLASWAAVFVAGRNSEDGPVVLVRAVTFRNGYVTTARFAPDGQTIVYGAAWDGGPIELYSGRRDSPEAKSLGLPPAGIYAISSTGEMAISLGCRFMEGFGDCRGTLAVVPLAGGAPRELLEDVVGADFGPDAKELAVARIAGEKHRLEFPLGTVLYETSGFIVHPRVSPRGDLVAFIEHPPGAGPGGSAPGTVTVVDRKGAKRVLAAGFQWGLALAWSPNGREVWFVGRKDGSSAVRAVTLSGRERQVDQGRGRVVDIGGQGQALLLRGNTQTGLVGLAPGEATERNLAWLDYSVAADLSADGRTLLFDERLAGASGGSFTVYLRKTDGSAAVKLGVGTALSLSPDGKWALAMTAPGEIVLLPTGAGSTRRLPRGSIEGYQGGTFLPDNRRVLLVAKEKGHAWRCYVQDLENGQVRAVTSEGVSGAVVSPDGLSVVAAPDNKPEAIYPLAGGPPRVIPGLQTDGYTVRWSADGRALYRVRSAGLRATLYRLDLASGRAETLKELRPVDPAGLWDFAGSVLVSADGRSYVYSYSRTIGQLYWADGLR